MELKAVEVKIPEGANVILGQAHFIKTTEDLYETMATTVPGSEFGLAFSEASGECLVRHDGNSVELERAASEACAAIGAGHSFVIIMRKAYPISVLNAIKSIQEVCSVYCATANPLIVVVAEESGRRGIMGVLDGYPPKGIESEKDKEARKAFLRKIGYKR
ncbi:MAG: adenosine-specific kinase [Candidatus Verstraetearchaeota archaeon]|nr:adenosine-specific kinase [Candidatus Verstraetearchaeota archaeon]